MKAILTWSRNWMEWNEVDGKSTAGAQLGKIYTILKMKRKGPALIDVKIKDKTEIATQDEIKAAITRFKPLIVELVDLEEDAFMINGKLIHTATAESVKLVDGAGGDLLDYGTDID